MPAFSDDPLLGKRITEQDAENQYLFDSRPNVISTRHDYELLRRSHWAHLTGATIEESYKQWGDESLVQDWTNYVKVRVNQGAYVSYSVLTCLEMLDRKATADFIRRNASEEQMSMSKRRSVLPKNTVGFSIPSNWWDKKIYKRNTKRSTQVTPDIPKANGSPRTSPAPIINFPSKPSTKDNNYAN